MKTVISPSIQKQDFIQHLAENLGIPAEPEKAEKVAKAILGVLRHYLYSQDARDFGSTLPPFLRSYLKVDFTYSRKKRFITEAQLKADLMAADPGLILQDEFSTTDFKMLLQHFFKTLAHYLSQNDQLRLYALLPSIIGQLWLETVLI